MIRRKDDRRTPVGPNLVERRNEVHILNGTRDAADFFQLRIARRFLDAQCNDIRRLAGVCNLFGILLAGEILSLVRTALPIGIGKKVTEFDALFEGIKQDEMPGLCQVVGGCPAGGFEHVVEDLTGDGFAAVAIVGRKLFGHDAATLSNEFHGLAGRNGKSVVFFAVLIKELLFHDICAEGYFLS